MMQDKKPIMCSNCNHLIRHARGSRSVIKSWWHVHFQKASNQVKYTGACAFCDCDNAEPPEPEQVKLWMKNRTH